MEAEMKNITVRVHEHLNLEQSQKVLALVLGKAGCPTCYSGLNIAFESAVNPAPTVMTVEKGGQSVSIAG
jgi:hypothetical protein